MFTRKARGIDQSLFNVGPLSTTLAQNQTSINHVCMEGIPVALAL